LVVRLALCPNVTADVPVKATDPTAVSVAV